MVFLVKARQMHRIDAGVGVGVGLALLSCVNQLCDTRGEERRRARVAWAVLAPSLVAILAFEPAAKLLATKVRA